MTSLKEHLKQKYGLSNYQIAQLAFVFKTVSSELSKMLIMGIIFHQHLKMYFFLLILMSCLRSFSGGIHFYTYWSCLASSVIYMWSNIAVLSNIAVPRYTQIFLLLACIVICYLISPVLSKYRVHFPEKQLYFCRNITCLIIFTYTLVLYIIPENAYFLAGFWMIILHSLQLIVAKIKKKGELTN